MISPHRAAGDLWVLASSQAAPGHGILPVNAYLFRGDSPVLVDTGLSAEGDDFVEALWSLVPPAELATVFLTHEDADHAGNLFAVLEAAPQARLVTNYVTLSKLQEAVSVPLDRVQVVNPGQPVPGTDGRLTVVRPPVYDAPGTVGLHAELRPTLLLSSHGALARDRTDPLLEGLRSLPAMEPYVPPDQAAFEELRAEMGG